jgi:hypothetical protein
VLALLSLVLADAAVGLAYRAVTGQSIYYGVVDPGRGRERAYRTRSDLYHHDLRPNVDVEGMWGEPYRVATNSLAFRDRRAREVALDAAGPRVVFLGDSFTEGVGVDYEGSFVGRIDAELAPRGIEVLNAGVSSYAPAIYVRKLRHLLDERGLRFSHLVVFLDVSDIHDDAEAYALDERGDVVVRGRADHARRDLLRAYSVLYAAPRLLKLRREQEDIARRRAASPINATLDFVRALWTVDEHWLRRYGERGLRIAREHLDAIAALCREHGIDLTLVVYPWPTQVVRRDLDSLQVRFWREWAAERDVRFIDLFPGFVSADDDAANLRTIRELFIAHDFHWNAAGHARVARLFLERFPLAGGSPAPQPPRPPGPRTRSTARR